MNGFISEAPFTTCFFSLDIIYLMFIHADKFYLLILITMFHFMNILHRWMFKSFSIFCYYNV